ncbi:malonate decarboxylase holo-[acyl-carrier-protein] synthase [Piscinibacter terrae]|uniref:Malonate decarboxylase holo-[acyl-carrier-protein] synthase n=1 Tax=Piscinibacter terrae TaxID=2496871 RepID=A0A3N7HN33_9BURK|nr:malonate decarboxylase holo-[acyl-carrier-protein] synthase [Albitalea terrae]RQP23510.1 malonate decarboxylase holo-[acyl-carrier-protein] synthase [Albitalea terrae]
MTMHRHQMARLSSAGWQRLLNLPWDTEAHDCLHHWADQQLPLVVTRQADDDAISLGLSAPRRWRHRRLAIRVQRAEVLFFDEFPLLEKLVPQLPHSARTPARQLASSLRACDATARVYGSHGWQYLTGLQHVHESSDIDVWVSVTGPDHADAVAAALDAFAAPTRRLDGELVFDGDAAVAWREWMAWRNGRARGLLVKRLRGVAMPASLALLDASELIA